MKWVWEMLFGLFALALILSLFELLDAIDEMTDEVRIKSDRLKFDREEHENGK